MEDTPTKQGEDINFEVEDTKEEKDIIGIVEDTEDDKRERKMESKSILLQSNEENDFVQVILSPEAVRLSACLMAHAQTSPDSPFRLVCCSSADLPCCVELLEFSAMNSIPSIQTPLQNNWENQLDEQLQNILVNLTLKSTIDLLKIMHALNVRPLVRLLTAKTASFIKSNERLALEILNGTR